MPVFLKIWLRRISIRISRRPILLRTLFFGYIGALVVFSLVGERSLFTSYQLWSMCKKLDVETIQLQNEIEQYRRNVYLFRHDLRTIEKYAREELRLAGTGEIHYIFR